MWEKGFTFTLGYVAGGVGGKTACEILQQNLFNINPKFQVSMQLRNWPTPLSEMKLGPLPMFPNGWTADYPDPRNLVFPFMHGQGIFCRMARLP